MNTIIEAIKSIRNDNNFVAEYMTEQREHFSNEQIKESEYKVSFLDSLLDRFGY